MSPARRPGAPDVELFRVDERAKRVERAFFAPTMVAAALVVPVVVIYDSHPGAGWDLAGLIMNWASWLIFVAHLVTMLVVVPDRRRWLADNPLDVAITLLTPPFLVVLAPIRLLRLAALVRLAPLVRRLFTNRGLHYTAVAAGVVVLASGAAFTFLEPGRSLADGIYLSITTMTTLGSAQPTTVAAKALSVVVVIVGIGFVAILTGAIAQRFVEPTLEEALEEVEGEGADLAQVSNAHLMAELRRLNERIGQLEERLR
jgi:voltage-gated potassium channel